MRRGSCDHGNGEIQIDSADARFAHELAVMKVWSRIICGAVIEIPQMRQTLLGAGQSFEHTLPDFRQRAPVIPDAQFVDLTTEVAVRRVSRQSSSEQVGLRDMNVREAGRVGVLRDQPPVCVEQHATRSADRRQMNPLVAPQQPLGRGGEHGRWVGLGVARVDVEAQIGIGGVVEQADGLPARSRLKDARESSELRPLGPDFDRGLREVFENIRRQCDVAAVAVQLQRPVRDGGRLRRDQAGGQAQRQDDQPAREQGGGGAPWRWAE